MTKSQRLKQWDRHPQVHVVRLNRSLVVNAAASAFQVAVAFGDRGGRQPGAVAWELAQRRHEVTHGQPVQR